MLVVGDLLIVSMEMLTTQGLAQAIAVKECTGADEARMYFNQLNKTSRPIYDHSSPDWLKCFHSSFLQTCPNPTTTVASCPYHVYLMVINGLVNKVKFHGLITNIW